MGKKTRVAVMSRAQASCCRLLSASLCKSTEVHGTGGRESVAFLGGRRYYEEGSHGAQVVFFPS